MNSHKTKKRPKKHHHRKNKHRGDKPPKNKNIKDKLMGNPFELSSDQAEADLHK